MIAFHKQLSFLEVPTDILTNVSPIKAQIGIWPCSRAAFPNTLQWIDHFFMVTDIIFAGFGIMLCQINSAWPDTAHTHVYRDHIATAEAAFQWIAPEG